MTGKEIIFEVGKRYSMTITEEYEVEERISEKGTGVWDRKINLNPEYKKGFIGEVVQICENHIVFYRLDTVGVIGKYLTTEEMGYKESFLKWDLEKFKVIEIPKKSSLIA